MDFKLTTNIALLSGVGTKLQPKLKKLGIESAQDLLLYFPFRYDDFRNLASIEELQDLVGEDVTVQAKLQMIKNRRGWKSKKNITEAIFADEDSNVLRVVWFNQPYLTKVLRPGNMVNLSGKIKVDALGPQLIAPTYEKFTGMEQTHTGRLVPIYPTTSGITQKQIRFLISQVIDLSKELEEWIPESILEKNDFIEVSQAVRGVHFPIDNIDLENSLKRLKFGELFTLQLKGALARKKRQEQKAPIVHFKEEKIKEFIKTLPFELTGAQKKSSWDILQDLEKKYPMNRLLSGDVGSGKTVVAGTALLNTVLNGYQAVILAPTEILATQHFSSLKEMLPKGISIGLFTKDNIKITGKTMLETSKAGRKKRMIEFIENGVVDIVVGTHAILSDKLTFSKLGLVIVDEQHRFGVEQRRTIKEKVSSHPTSILPSGRGGSQAVHFLSMTATPIPRSLALMLYGDLDISQIDELPRGRKKILTRLAPKDKRPQAYKFIESKIEEGRQAFVICPLVDGQEGSEKKSVLEEYKKLSKEIYPDLEVGCLYGKMKSKDKEKVMEDFKNKALDILVSTSVIEVGVDVPNAVIMMIEGAENFGLAQLHQFRGRVGRSKHQSYCFLFAETENEESVKRLKYFEELDDGFELAERDLETRGPGEVYGKKQSGGMKLKIARLSDRALIKKARKTAQFVIDNLDKTDYKKLKKRVGKMAKGVHLE